MKKQPLSMLALASLLILSSCGQTAGVKTAGAQQATGEIIASSETAVAQTESGKVGGFLQDGIYIYKGIPYAKAERFMPPQPADKWEGVRSSRMFGPTCPQAVRMGWGADEHAFAFHWDDGYPGEDCLRVNIWTPGLNDGKKRPVMVWLHGGGYAAGSGQELPSYDGFNLAKKGDAVVVTLNHRLNVLGFLDLSAYGDKYAKSGNAGLLDLVAALQWVNKNIAAFGGDAQNVTIFGQSGGGGKVSTLLATPSAKGLYHKAIVQSGSMLRTMDAKYSRRIGAAVMDELGLKASQIDELQKMPYERLLAAGEKAVAKVKAEAEKEDGVSTFIFGWAPTVDGDVLPAQPFDPQAPAQSKDVPVMIGTTLHEFTMSTYVPAFRTITKEKAVEFLKQRYGDRRLREGLPRLPAQGFGGCGFRIPSRCGGASQTESCTAGCSGLYVHVRLGISGARWHVPQHALHGDTFRLQQCRGPRLHDGRRRRSAGPGREDERRLAELRPHGQSQCRGPAPVGCLYRRGRSHDVLQQPLRGEAPPRQGVAGGGTGVPYTGILRL